MIRFLDIVIAGISVLLLFPIFLVVTVCILLETGRPVIFRQTRVGLNGRLFDMLKFRSMNVGASKSGPYYTETNDRRITRVGRFIRKFSLDELPQLINVLAGDMSIVGPRPNLPVQSEQFDPADLRRRNSVRPGITGLAQVRGRSESAIEDRLKNDLQWVADKSVSLYLKIIFETFLIVIGRKGIN